MQSTSAAPTARHLPIRKEWLAATQEEALEPDRPIIDPHTICGTGRAIATCSTT